MIYAILAPDYGFFCIFYVCLRHTHFNWCSTLHTAVLCAIMLFRANQTLHNREHKRGYVKIGYRFLKRSSFDILKREKLQRKQINMMILTILLLFYYKRHILYRT